MDQQTLWLPPGTCVLNPVPTMQFQPTSGVTSYHQLTTQLMKQQQLLHHSCKLPSATNVHTQALLHQSHVMHPAQNFVRVPPLDNVLVPTNGKQLIEIPCAPANVHLEQTIPLPLTTTFLTTDMSTIHSFGVASKVVKKKRISPSAKRRSRLRLIAFLEAKKKQQSELNLASADDATTPENPSDNGTQGQQVENKSQDVESGSSTT